MSSEPWPMLPRLYAILDAELLERRGLHLVETAEDLARAGVRLLQLRDKRDDAAVVLREATRLARALAGSGCRLLLNDYVDLVQASGADGAHVGQGDLSPVEARARLGAGKMLGVSTHSQEQLRRAAAGPADYVAIGPVFGTLTKADADPVVGLEGVRLARSLTAKPLVAIGGITAERAPEVLRAGADSIAVISALYAPGRAVEASARELVEVVAAYTA